MHLMLVCMALGAPLVCTIMDSRAQGSWIGNGRQSGLCIDFPHYYGFIGWKCLKFGKTFA